MITLVTICPIQSFCSVIYHSPYITFLCLIYFITGCLYLLFPFTYFAFTSSHSLATIRSLYLWVCFHFVLCFRFHIQSEILQYFSLSNISLSILLCRLIYVVCKWQVFFFMAEYYSVIIIILSIILLLFWASLIAQLVKNPPAMQETLVWFLDWEDLLEKG